MWSKAIDRAGLRRSPPYDLRHAFASLQIRAGVSIPELAEQLGHSPQMTLTTYTHVIRELRGVAPLSMEQQIRQAREGRIPSAEKAPAEAGGGSRVSSVCPESQGAES